MYRMYTHIYIYIYIYVYVLYILYIYIYILEFDARQRRAIKQQRRKTEIESEVANMCPERIQQISDTFPNRRACFLVAAPWNHVTVLRRPSGPPEGGMRK